VSEFAAYCVLAVIFALIWWGGHEASRHSEQCREIAHRAMFGVPRFLRETTGVGPWFRMDDFHREMFFDIKCKDCEIDVTYVCNASGETEFADLHHKKGKTTIHRGEKVLFEGNALDLMGYPQEGYTLLSGQPPLKESDAYGLYQQYMRHRDGGTLDQFLEDLGAPRDEANAAPEREKKKQS